MDHFSAGKIYIFVFYKMSIVCVKWNGVKMIESDALDGLINDISNKPKLQWSIGGIILHDH